MDSCPTRKPETSFPSNNVPTKTKPQSVSNCFVWGKRKLALVVQIQTSRQTNWELTLSEVWNKLGQDLIPPQSLIEAAYVCHELLSSNIWGFSQPSNSWGLISWDLPWSVQESGLSEPPSEDWEAFGPCIWLWYLRNIENVFCATRDRQSSAYPCFLKVSDQCLMIMASGGKYIYSSVVLCLSISILCYTYFFTFQREILYRLLHYIHLSAIVSSYFSDQDFTLKKHVISLKYSTVHLQRLNQWFPTVPNCQQDLQIKQQNT